MIERAFFPGVHVKDLNLSGADWDLESAVLSGVMPDGTGLYLLIAERDYSADDVNDMTRRWRDHHEFRVFISAPPVPLKAPSLINPAKE